MDDVKSDLNGVKSDLGEVASAADLKAHRADVAASGNGAAVEKSTPAPRRFDLDAT